MSYKILILEDNALLVETLEDFLGGHHFTCKSALCGKEALKWCYEEKFDLYLLDVKLPDMSGFDFLKALRTSNDTTPAIFLTSANDKASVQEGFLLGADDYIKKPFDLEELLWRMNALLARTKGSVDTWLVIDERYKLNVIRKRLYEGDRELDVHLKDIELLELLVQNRGLVVTKEMIYAKLWSCSEEMNEGSIRVYINNLKKIFGKDKIFNIRGIGYRFES
jgi:DNA-binding response OmpR family regulator